MTRRRDLCGRSAGQIQLNYSCRSDRINGPAAYRESQSSNDTDRVPRVDFPQNICEDAIFLCDLKTK